MGMVYSMYASDARQAIRSDEMNAILTVSQRNNAVNQITGFLYHEEGVFLQYIEGPEKAIFDTLNRIKKDVRHTGFRLLSTGALKHRYFSEWDMGLVQQSFISLKQLALLEGSAQDLEQVDFLDILVFLSSNSEMMAAKAA